MAVADVRLDQEVAVGRGGKRFDPLLQPFALVGKGQVGPCSVTGLGDPPGDGAVIRDPHDESALSR
jgi:hypothetical protein